MYICLFLFIFVRSICLCLSLFLSIFLFLFLFRFLSLSLSLAFSQMYGFAFVRLAGHYDTDTHTRFMCPAFRLFVARNCCFLTDFCVTALSAAVIALSLSVM